MDQTGPAPSNLDISYLYATDMSLGPSTTQAIATATLGGEMNAKRSPQDQDGARPSKKPKTTSMSHGAGMGLEGQDYASENVNGSEQTGTNETSGGHSKPKRVRTGCLTCRERHLKCDEAMPSCLNCRKSARECKRGVRLNFIDTTCQAPPKFAAGDEWNVSFLDESREIAREYKGGIQKYANLHVESNMTSNNTAQYDYSTGPPSAPAMSHQTLPSIQGMLPEGVQDESQSMNLFDQPREYQNSQGHPSAESTHSNSAQPRYEHQSQQQIPEAKETRQILNTPEETLFMQVFVEEVGVWMDSMDSMKHFSRLLPFHALEEPMLLNAFFACGVRHLTLVNPAVYKEEKALSYYDSASRYLLRALENPERNSVICAVTAVILNVYEIMTEKALPRMNHIAGARALIKECNWDARSSGVGAACFWLNVGMELLSNLHFNWRASWNPDTWGIDLDFTPDTEPGREEIWTHRIVYIAAKVSDFRATVPRTQEASPRNEQIRRQKRLEEWMNLKGLADMWNANIPRSMHPMAYLYPYQTTSKSAFPEVWLIKRTTIVARLFYHTIMCLLAQVNPIMSKEVPEMHQMEQHHAHQICGITAHVKDRGVASVAIRSLAIAAECLTIRREQEEVLRIFTKIHKETGWRIGFLPKDLSEKWGWEVEPSMQLPTQANPHPQGFSNGNNASQPLYSEGQSAPPSAGGSGGNRRTSQYQFDQYGEMQRLQQQAQAAQHQHQSSSSPASSTSGPASASTAPSSAPSGQQQRKQPPQGIVNPMFATADFGMAKHPYQEYYVAPHHSNAQTQQQLHGHGQGLALPMHPFLGGGVSHGTGPGGGGPGPGPGQVSGSWGYQF